MQPVASPSGWVRASAAADVPPGGSHAVKLGGHLVALFREGDALHAVDNRCPHMGFPMTKGTLKDGVLTCHWHQWQFDACSGGCLSPGSRGTDLATYPVEVRSAGIWVKLPPASGRDSRAVERLGNSLDRAVFDASTLRAAKAVYSLLEAGGTPASVARIAALRALPLENAFGGGAVSLAAVANVLALADLPLEDRTLALSHAVRTTSLAVRGTAPRRSEIPLPEGTATSSDRMDRERALFLGFVEDREVQAAERLLVTALGRGEAPAFAAGWVLAAATDHVFNNLGHTLDFANKAFELLGHIGWEHAGVVLPPLLPLIADGTRHEEDMAWKRPVDLIAMIREGERSLPGKDNPAGLWKGEAALTEALLGEDAGIALAGIPKALAEGASWAEAARALALAASLRVARFHTLNEFGDWDTVHHAFTHAHALFRTLEAFPSRALARGLFHAAGYLWLARYLNVPRVKLPHENGGKAPEATFEELVERRDVDGAAALAFRGPDPAALARAAFREDLNFHTVQHVDAALRLHRSLAGHPLQYVPLAGLARWLAAHGPTPRAVRQTVTNAIKLQRGEALHEG